MQHSRPNPPSGGRAAATMHHRTLVGSPAKPASGVPHAPGGTTGAEKQHETGTCACTTSHYKKKEQGKSRAGAIQARTTGTGAAIRKPLLLRAPCNAAAAGCLGYSPPLLLRAHRPTPPTAHARGAEQQPSSGWPSIQMQRLQPAVAITHHGRRRAAAWLLERAPPSSAPQRRGRPAPRGA